MPAMPAATAVVAAAQAPPLLPVLPAAAWPNEAFWAPASSDASAFSAVEAAALGTPSAGTDLPILHEIGGIDDVFDCFGLDDSWLDALCSDMI
jgi:hypothetical protein